MDELDKMILRSANTIKIEALGIGSGNCHNSIYIEWSIPQDDSILQEEPLNRVLHWAIPKKLWGENRKFTIDFIPSNIDANEVAFFLAKEFKKRGKDVHFYKWISPGKSELVSVH